MNDVTGPAADRATAELDATLGALERAREGSAQARRGDVVELAELTAENDGADAGRSTQPQ